jgi:hypothetical protein
MKLAIATTFLLASAKLASAGVDTKKILRGATRVLEEAEEEEEEEYGFLGNYKLKLLSCNQGVRYKNPENGEYEGSSVVFRLCPSSNGCDDDDSKGCKSGYGDYTIGLNTFVEQYIEDKEEEMNGDDDEYDMKQFGECREVEADQDADDDGANRVQYYIGPACSDDGVGVTTKMFTDQYCTEESEDVTYEDISNGVSLPYSEGGLVSNSCESCTVANDNGEYELSDMCMELYENSGKCETEMETYHYQGQQLGSCEVIAEMLPKSGAGAAVMWFLVVAIAVGAAGYTVMKAKQSKDERDSNFGLMNE